MAIGAALLLQGCVSTAEEQAGEDHRVCIGYGLAYGSPQYVDCRRSVVEDRNRRQDAYERTRSMQILGNSMVKAVEASKPAPKPQVCRFERQPNGWDTRVCR